MVSEDEYVQAIRALGAELSEEHSRWEYQMRLRALMDAYGMPH